MSNSERGRWGDLVARTVAALRTQFSLQADRADDAEIDARIRADVPIQGTNLWVLVLAIFIASIGLNVNSTAVIIGAMLISPLMGPIMGAGYGIGIRDATLVRQAGKSLAIATLIALVTSTAYFAISPLRAANSELLARTTQSRKPAHIAARRCVCAMRGQVVDETPRQRATVNWFFACSVRVRPGQYRSHKRPVASRFKDAGQIEILDNIRVLFVQFG
jgi:hypothetical protein